MGPWVGDQQAAKPASGNPEACGQGSTGAAQGQNWVCVQAWVVPTDTSLSTGEHILFHPLGVGNTLDSRRRSPRG